MIPTGVMDDAPAPRYGSWAALYQRYRPGYPAAVFATLASAITGPRALCVELGAGSGQATLDLVHQFDRVVAIEPDPDMAGRIPTHPQIEVRVDLAEDVGFAPESVDAVVAATALHWMPQLQVVRAARRWLRPRGVFFAFALGPLHLIDQPPGLRALIARHLHRTQAHAHARITSWHPYSEVLGEAGGFADVEPFACHADHSWDPLSFAGFLMSLASGQALAQATGDADAALTSLAADIAEAAQGTPIRVRLPVEGALAVAGAAT